jgi:hypothetical protein
MSDGEGILKESATQQRVDVTKTANQKSNERSTYMITKREEVFNDPSRPKRAYDSSNLFPGRRGSKSRTQGNTKSPSQWIGG